MLLACLTIVPIALLHCLWVSDVETGYCAGLRIVSILLFMCVGFCSWFVEASGLSLAVLLHSFRSFASLIICLRPALDIGGLVVWWWSCPPFGFAWAIFEWLCHGFHGLLS